MGFLSELYNNGFKVLSELRIFRHTAGGALPRKYLVLAGCEILEIKRAALVAQSCG